MTGWFFSLLFPHPSKSFNGLAIRVKFFMKWQKYLVAPMNFLIPVNVVTVLCSVELLQLSSISLNPNVNQPYNLNSKISLCNCLHL